MGRVSFLTIALLLISSLVLSPVFADPRDGGRASDVTCEYFRGLRKCPPPKEDVAVTKQVCYFLRGERVCVGPPPTVASKKP